MNPQENDHHHHHHQQQQDDAEEQLESQQEEEKDEKEEEEGESKSMSSPPPSINMNSSPPPPKPPSPPPPKSTSPPQSPAHPSLVQSSQPQFVSPPHSTHYVPDASPSSVAVEVKALEGEDDLRQVVEEGVGGSKAANSERKLRPNLSILRKVKRENVKRNVLLGFRCFGFAFCLVSFSVMAADNNQGWALDSFHRYKEFRYCMSVNVIGFVYSALQACYVAYAVATGKHVVRSELRHLLDFSLDQTLTYLLLSASSSATFRVEDWESNWGKDNFPTMAKASVTLSFLAFVAFALSSLISGHTLFTPNSW